MDEPITLGEVFRLQQALNAELHAFRGEFDKQHHSLRNKLETNSLGLGILSQRMQTAETRLDGIEPKVEAIGRRAAFIAGGIAVVSFLGEFFNPWRR